MHKNNKYNKIADWWIIRDFIKIGIKINHKREDFKFAEAIWTDQVDKVKPSRWALYKSVN